MKCWHRPGKALFRWVFCRHCGVLIQWCPCVGPHFRSVDDDCRMCHGSMWVAV